jgi:hypothetical protein
MSEPLIHRIGPHGEPVSDDDTPHPFESGSAKLSPGDFSRQVLAADLVYLVTPAPVDEKRLEQYRVDGGFIARH